MFRCLRAILAVYVLAWFHVVVPAHTRGMVTMPGTDDAAGCCADVAAKTAPCCTPTNRTSGKPAPTPDQQRRCAVCFIASTYSIPVVYVIDLQPAEQLEQSSLAATAQVESLDFPHPFWPTGPPTLAV